MFSKILTALGATALAASAVAAPAAAAPQEETSAVVSYAGLDLSKASDAARLERRIRAAAQEVCGEVPARDLVLGPAVKACQANAIARAKTEMALAMRSGGGRTVALRTN